MSKLQQEIQLLLIKFNNTSSLEKREAIIELIKRLENDGIRNLE